MNETIATRAATSRAYYRLTTPGASQIAIALEHRATHFLSNVAKLKAVDVTRVVLLNELA